MGLIMDSLDTIGIRNQTDKASQFSRTYAKPHDYLRHMELFFAPLRDKPIKLVEIGVGGGESIRTWLEYFTFSLVVGIDNAHDTNPWNTAGIGTHARYHFHAADQTDLTFWKCFAADYGPTIDIAIDDGSHEPKAVQMSFGGLWPLIKPGGIYAIEDLGCGFTSSGWPTHGEFLASLTEPLMLVGVADIDSIYIAKELCIIRKKLCTPS